MPFKGHAEALKQLRKIDRQDNAMIRSAVMPWLVARLPGSEVLDQSQVQLFLSPTKE